MNLVGYLVTLANLQNFVGPDGTLQDLSVAVSDVFGLAETLKYQPGFPIEVFRDTGFYRSGNVGKYLSKNLRDYIFNAAPVDPRDDGVILTLFFADKQPVSRDDGGLTYFVHKDEVSDDVTNAVVNYIANRNKRSIY